MVVQVEPERAGQEKRRLRLSGDSRSRLRTRRGRGQCLRAFGFLIMTAGSHEGAGRPACSCLPVPGRLHAVNAPSANEACS
jgi:hypothetical protein